MAKEKSSSDHSRRNIRPPSRVYCAACGRSHSRRARCRRGASPRAASTACQEQGRRGEREKGRGGDKETLRFCFLPISLSPFLRLSPLPTKTLPELWVSYGFLHFLKSPLLKSALQSARRHAGRASIAATRRRIRPMVSFGPSLGEQSGSGCVSEEHAVGADGHRGTGKRFDHRPVSAGGVAQAARLLHAMSRIEDPPARPGPASAGCFACHSPAAHSRRMFRALPNRILRQPQDRKLADHVFHVARERQNWPFFTWTGRPDSAAAVEQVRLSAQKCGNLQHIADLGRGHRLLGQMDIRSHR